MNNGYVKLHRSILNNPLFFKDKNATYLFIALLLLVDRKTGIYTGGRYKLSAFTGIKPITCYKTLKRLEKEKMCILRVNGKETWSKSQGNAKYTEITVLNWSKYQHEETQRKRNVNVKETQRNTKQEERLKNIVSKDTSVVSKLYYEYLKKYRIPVLNHNTLRLKIKELEDSNGTEWSVRYLTFMLEQYETLDMKYKPEINDALDLFKKSKSIEEKLKKLKQSEEIY